jgi:hypothetical protein
VPLLASKALAKVAEVLPGAHSLVTFGERGADDVPRVRVTAVLHERGAVPSDGVRGDGEGTVGVVLSGVECYYLDLLSEVAGGDVLGRQWSELEKVSHWRGHPGRNAYGASPPRSRRVVGQPS